MITPSSFGRLFRAAAFVALPLLATSARAELLAYDGFNHATGALAGQTGPSGFNGAYTAFGTGSNVATPGLTFPGLTVVGNKVTLSGTNVGVNAALANAPQTVGSRLYFSFLLQSVGSGSAGLSFCQGSNETLFVGSRSSYLGVDPKGGTAANTSLAPTTATMVVGRIDFAASGATIRLYVNPTSTVEPVYSRLTVAKTSALTFDGIRIWSTGTAGSFDEFRLGTTYADVAPVTVGAAAEKIVVLGSSVAAGTGASTQSEAWAYRFKTLMETQTPIVPGSAAKWQVANASIGGDTTPKVLARFQNDLVNAYPDADIVIIGLSLANEGLVGASGAGAQAVYDSFKAGLAQIISQCREKGYYPVISLVYPNDNYTAEQYALVKKMNVLLNTWEIPSVNFLGTTDNNSGRWAAGYVADAYHPNSAGHAELYSAVVPSLFEAIAAGKVAFPRLQGTPSALRLQRDDGQAAPIRFTPNQAMRSFTISFRVRTKDLGTVAAVTSGANRATVEVRDDALVYLGPGASTISVPIDANSGRWYDVALSHRYATNQTFLFVDGVLRGTVTDSYVPDSFVFGGAAGASGRALAPAEVDLQDVCVYRSVWTQEEALAQSTGALQQASLEICAPLADLSPANGAALENRAQSLATITLNTASFTKLIAMPPDELTADSFTSTTTSLTWNGHGADSFVVERRRTGTAEAWTTVANPTKSSYEDSGLVASQSYDYRVSTSEGALQGDYSNVATIVAGGQSAVSYQNWISRYYLNDGAVYLVDFNTNASPAYNGVRWNTVTSQTSTAPYALVNTANQSAGYTLTLTDSFDQFRTDGTTPLAGYASAAQTTMFAVRDDVPLSGAMTFGGLVPGAIYDFAFLARRGALVAGYDYTGTYTFTGSGAPAVAVVDGATSAALTKVSVAASETGTVTLKITAGPGTGTDFPVINFIQFARSGGDQAYLDKIAGTADPDNDGISNFEEYARGLQPAQASTVQPLGLSGVAVNAGGQIEFKVDKNRRAKDVNYVVERSTDLVNWAVDTQATSAVVDRNGAIETAVYTAQAGEDRAFFRMRLQ